MALLSRVAARWRGYRPSKRLLLAACVASFPLAIVVGFATDGWVTGGRARMLSALAADNARVALVATACANRFLAAPDAAARLDALRGRAAWDRGLALQEGGWTTLSGLENIPGSQEPFEGVGDLCAERLLVVAKPPAQDAQVANSRSAAPHV